MRKAASPRSSSTALCRISRASALLLSRFGGCAAAYSSFDCAKMRRGLCPSAFSLRSVAIRLLRTPPRFSQGKTAHRPLNTSLCP